MVQQGQIAGIYGRKSLFTGKGESVQNQINMGIEYAQSKGWDYQIYTDEGYSGSNTDRPGFQQMLRDIELGKIQHVIFYRLDRISRRILDICEFIEELSNKNIGFISLTENFDTTSPLGRAMVHIAATFAQLEREMLAQRVRDNMIQLAKTGRWLGGITPTGYESERVEYITEDMKKKSMFVLKEIPNELKLVSHLFDKYLELQSLSALEKYCIKYNIKTKNGKDFQKMTLRVILTNPVYIKADQLAYEYFTQQGMQIANPPEDFNGRHGILSYNKNIEKKGKSNKLRDVSEWILAIGNHKGIIDSIKWIQVQKLLEKNKDKAPRAGTSAAALLSGILRCGKCNSFIKVKYGQIKKGTDTRISYYVCNNKSISGGVRCDNTNVRTDVLESLVEEKLMEITSKQEYILSELEKEEKQGLLSYKSEQNNISVLKAQIEEINKKIDNLLNQLENEDKNSRASKRIKQRIEELEKEIENSNEKLKLATKNAEGINADNISLQLFKQSLINFSTLYNKTDDINLKRNLISSIVNQIRWYDGTVDIDIIGVKKN